MRVVYTDSFAYIIPRNQREIWGFVLILQLLVLSSVNI